MAVGLLDVAVRAGRCRGRWRPGRPGPSARARSVGRRLRTGPRRQHQRETPNVRPAPKRRRTARIGRRAVGRRISGPPVAAAPGQTARSIAIKECRPCPKTAFDTFRAARSSLGPFLTGTAGRECPRSGGRTQASSLRQGGPVFFDQGDAGQIRKLGHRPGAAVPDGRLELERAGRARCWPRRGSAERRAASSAAYAGRLLLGQGDALLGLPADLFGLAEQLRRTR